jgi:hypothetical protein
MKINLTFEQVAAMYFQHDYPLDKTKINVFGIRAKDRTSDKWNDVLGIVYPEQKVLAFSGTTDPGSSPLMGEGSVNPDGIFILLPGFYEDCFKKGYHKGKYPALVQRAMGIFKGYRDNNKDGKLDFSGKIYTDVTGLNFHTTRWDKKVQKVGQFSHACQVLEVAQEYDRIMVDVIMPSPQIVFSYALFEQQ